MTNAARAGVIARDVVVLVRRPDDVVAVRAVVARDAVVRAVVVRAVDVLRDFTELFVARETTLFCADVRAIDVVNGPDSREIVDALRTVAPETLAQTKHAKITGNTFLILTIEIC